MRETDHKGFVLRRQDYGDTSMLVDVFTRTSGRFRLVAKGVRSGKGAKARAIQPFSDLLLGWSGRSELKTLIQIESVQNYALDKQAAVCGFYLNELLWNFLEINDPHQDLFDVYQQSLHQLAEGFDLESTLRVFEFFLLKDIGYEAIFDIDSESGEPLEPSQGYRFELEQGLVKSSGDDAYVGDLFLAIANNDFSSIPVRKLAKRLSRQIICHRMEGKELHSRKWFMSNT